GGDGDFCVAGDDFVWVGVDTDSVVCGGAGETDQPAPDSQCVQDAVEAAALLSSLQAVRGPEGSDQGVRVREGAVRVYRAGGDQEDYAGIGADDGDFGVSRRVGGGPDLF